MTKGKLFLGYLCGSLSISFMSSLKCHLLGEISVIIYKISTLTPTPQPTICRGSQVLGNRGTNLSSSLAFDSNPFSESFSLHLSGVCLLLCFSIHNISTCFEERIGYQSCVLLVASWHDVLEKACIFWSLITWTGVQALFLTCSFEYLS